MHICRRCQAGWENQGLHFCIHALAAALVCFPWSWCRALWKMEIRGLMGAVPKAKAAFLHLLLRTLLFLLQRDLPNQGSEGVFGSLRLATTQWEGWWQLLHGQVCLASTRRAHLGSAMERSGGCEWVRAANSLSISAHLSAFAGGFVVSSTMEIMLLTAWGAVARANMGWARLLIWVWLLETCSLLSLLHGAVAETASVT